MTEASPKMKEYFEKINKEITKALKSELACGGTFRDNQIELQGDHVQKIKPLLIKLGFDESSIED